MTESKVGKWVLPVEQVFGENVGDYITSGLIARQIIASLALFAAEHNNHCEEKKDHVRARLALDIADEEMRDLLAKKVMAQVLGDKGIAKELNISPIDQRKRVYAERVVAPVAMPELSHALFDAYTEMIQTGQDQDILDLAEGRWPLSIEGFVSK